MKSLLDLLNYEFHLGKSVVLTPKAVLLAIVFYFFTWLLLKLIRRIVSRALDEEARVKFKGIFTFFNYFIYTIVTLVAFDTVGLNLTTIFAASAALLVGVGLALQTFIQDIISGVFILADQSVHVGDIIQVDGQIGKVERIQLRTTRAVTRDNRVLIIPNHKFMASILYNWTENGTLTRESVAVGVAYASDINRVKEILIETASEHPLILKKPAPLVLFNAFGESALEFELLFSINRSFESNIVKSDVRFAIDKAFRENTIEIPFPQRVIHQSNNTSSNG
ncbi:MAG TPA: mechanosensitive ion channel protein MscS [Flavobacteriaceae bacterium]|nr:MAG: Mechanosensitive channel MscK [Flavobacteriaceae bacterium]HCQ24747.1 mechanosensitive ion channel protein MscS [Flavobacteriaceae bacterium]|tara:strand:+ start:6741 stop:7580 length:840 start_codon:yes stop_codon:yes gene_type:complete